MGSVRRAGTGSRNKRQSSIRSGSQSSATGTLTKRPNGQLGRGRLILDTDGSLKKIESSSGSGGQKGDVEAGIETAYTKPSQKTVKDHVLGLIYSGEQSTRGLFCTERTYQALSFQVGGNFR